MATKKVEKKVEVKKTETKTTAKKAEVKTTAKKKEEPQKVEKVEKKEVRKVYHVSKRASDGKWQVFIKGSDKVIKLFKTKPEAEEYCAKMAKNQGATLAVHNSKGANKGKITKAKVKGGK